MKDCMYYDLEEYKKADRIGRKTKKVKVLKEL